MDYARAVREAQKIHGTRTPREQGGNGGGGTFFCEIAQKRIAGAERKEAQGNALFRRAVRKNAVENFVRGAITADGEKPSIALRVGFASELCGVTGRAGGNDVQRQSLRAQLRQLGAGKFCGAAAASGGIDDGDETFHALRLPSDARASRQLQKQINNGGLQR